ncbi:hypothetical protein D3C84_1098320 [compost metagenome]
MLSLRCGGEALVAIEQCEVAGTRLVTLAHLVEPSQVQRQSLQFAGGQQAALEHLGEQAAEVGLHAG